MIWPWRKKRTPQERLAASEGDEVEYCRTVCELADEAQALLRWGRTKRALELFGMIADLAVDEKTISPVVDHARRVLESRGYQEMFSPDFLHLAPDVATVGELHRVVTPEAVIVDDYDPAQPEIGLLFHCTWDDSHGLGVRVLGDTVLEVSPQDICL